MHALFRFAAICIAAASPLLVAHAADPSDKGASLPKPVLLPGEYAVTRFDLTRGMGQKWHSCLGHTTIAPGIAPGDLEVTYVQENSIKIAIKGTGDALICRGFYIPPMRELAHKTVFRFYDANRWNFDDIDRRANLRALAPPPLAGSYSGPVPAPAPASAPAPVASSTMPFSKCVGTDGKITYMEGPCPNSSKSAASGTAPGNTPALPAVQPGLWKIKVNRNGNENQTDHCGDPLENIAREISQAPSVRDLGCESRASSSAARSYSMVVDCPADRVSADGSRSVKKGQTTLSVTSPTQQSVTVSVSSTQSGLRETMQGVRVGNCQ